MVEAIVFYCLAVLSIVCALMVVMRRSLFDSALYLAGLLSLISGFFVMTGADFLAAVQILLYVGGVVVILAFAVMLSSVQQAKVQSQTNVQWPFALLGCGILLLVILISVKRHVFMGYPTPQAPTTYNIGRLLLGDMALPFEAVSLVLMASLVGAVLFSRREKDGNGGAS